jgi:hypothetical protein
MIQGIFLPRVVIAALGIPCWDLDISWSRKCLKGSLDKRKRSIGLKECPSPTRAGDDGLNLKLTYGKIKIC